MSRHGYLNRILDIICIVSLILGCTIIILIPNDNTPFRNRMTERLEDFSSGWMTEDGRECDLGDAGKTVKKGRDGNYKFVIYNHLPVGRYNDFYLNFQTKHIRMNVYVDNRLIYSFNPKENFCFTKGIGHSFHTAVFHKEDEGKRIQIEVFPCYHDGSGAVRSIYIGRPSDFQGMILDQKFNGFILCVFSIVVGLLLVITSLATKKQRKYGYRMRVLGILAICVGVWSVFETLVIQLLFGYSPKIHAMTYILLILMPYYLITYVNETIELKWKYSKQISFMIILLVVLMMGIQRRFYGRDFHETLEFIHVSIVLNVVLATYMIFRNRYYCIKNKIRSTRKAASMAVFLFMVLSSVDIVRYRFDRGINDAGAFMRIGIFVAILILSADLIRNIVFEIKNTEHMETMARLAYTDALTGMANRTAFEKKEKELELRIKEGELNQVFICQIDLNFLKKVNDNYGHAIGDRHIKACSKIINEVFGNDGFVFRVGGDEFTVFGTNEMKPSDFQERVNKIKELETKYNRVSSVPVPLHMALGYAIYTRDSFNSIKDAEMQADKKMYEFKEAMKKKGDLLNGFKGKI